MKPLLLLLLGALPAVAQSRVYTLHDSPERIDSLTGSVTYSEVIQCDSVPAALLFNRANLFLTKAFVNDAATTHYANATTGTVSRRGRVQLSLSPEQLLFIGHKDFYYEMALEVRVKDGRYRYEISNIESISSAYGRGKLNDMYRSYPKLAVKTMNRHMTERDYQQHLRKDPIMLYIGQLKAAMKLSTDKNDS